MGVADTIIKKQLIFFYLFYGIPKGTLNMKDGEIITTQSKVIQLGKFCNFDPLKS